MAGSIVLADVSHWQGTVDWTAYAKAAGETYHAPGITRASAAICKATQGVGGIDSQFTRNQRLMREHLDLRGFYHFYSATAPVKDQAEHFARTVGELRPGEFAALDVEQDAERARHEALCAAVDSLLGGVCWVYGGSQVRTERPVWVARYRDGTPSPGGEPTVGHVLWQFTETGRWPGVGGAVDLNVHRGDLASLLRFTVQEEDDMDEATLRRVLNEMFTATGSKDAADSVDDDRAKINALIGEVRALRKEVADLKTGQTTGQGGDLSGDYTLTVTRKA